MLPIRQDSEVIEGTNTQVLVQFFADRTLVLVTQLGKVGNMIQASLPPTIPVETLDLTGDIPSPSPGIVLTRLLGVANSEHLDTLHSLYASHIATIVWKTQIDEPLRRSVVVGIALRKTDSEETERKTFLATMKLVQKLLSTQ